MVTIWTIPLNGTVSRAEIEESTMANHEIESCILLELERMRFPEPDGGVVAVGYPFQFNNVTE